MPHEYSPGSSPRMGVWPSPSTGCDSFDCSPASLACRGAAPTAIAMSSPRVTTGSSDADVVGKMLARCTCGSRSCAPASGPPRRAERVAARVEDPKALEVTTVMIRNVPSNVTQFELVQALEEDGFADMYDFVYV